MLQTHSILPGALNDISCAFSSARLLTQDDSVFLVYASGDKIVFISQELTPIEKISATDLGLTGSLQVSALSASEFRGIVAAAWRENLFLFQTSTFTYQRNILRLQWTQIQPDPIVFRSEVRALAWNKLGTSLIVSHGDIISLYSLTSHQPNEEFQLELKWETRLAFSAHLVKFSPDGQLFATCGSQDRLLKVWYLHCDETHELLPRYTFCYLKHSTPVIGFSWRDTHLYMPKNGVPNALLTHTADNTAYVWVQKQSADQEDSDPISMYHCTTISPQLNLSFISSLPAETFTFAPVWVNNKVLLFADHMLEMQKRDTYGYNAEFNTDISTPAQTPTISANDTGDTDQFVLPDAPQDFAYATSLLKLVKRELTLLSSPLPPHVTSQLLNRWKQASDLILAINPLDGSILIWNLDNLDLDSVSYSVKKHSLSSRMPHNIPMEDAQCISTLIGLALYPSPIETQHDTHKCAGLPLSEPSYFTSFRSRGEIEDLVTPSTPTHEERSTKFLVDRLYFFSLHREGSLNIWHAMFSERSNYNCNVSGLVHVLTLGGHMFMEHYEKRHPSIPLLASVSQGEGKDGHSYKSDLILWRTDKIGMLNSSGGLKQTAKLLGRQIRDFSHTVWLPTLLCMKGNSVGSSSIPTGTFLLTSVDAKLAVFLTLCISPLDIWSSSKETNTSITQNFTEKNTNFSTFSNSNCPSFLYKLSDVIDIGEIKGDVLSIQVFSENSMRNLTPDTINDVTSYEEFECSLSEGVSYIIMLENIPNTQEQSYSVFDKEDGIGNQLMTTKTHVWRCEIRFESSLDSMSTNSILDRRVSKVTLFYDMITKLAYKIQIMVEKLNSEVLPFAGERLTFVEQVSQVADTGHTQFSPFLFSTLASSGDVTNWGCELDSDGAKWLPYPTPTSSRICLNTLLKGSNIFTPPTFLNVLSVHVADACLMALCFKHAESNSRFVAVLSCQGISNWFCEGVIEIAFSTTLCRTHTPRVEWIPCGDGGYILSCVWGSDISVYAKCYAEQMRCNIELSQLSEAGLNPLCGYVKSLAGKIGDGGSWVRIASFDVPLRRVTDQDSMSLYHVGGGALLFCVNAVLVLLSPWIHQTWEAGMTPTRFDKHSLSSSFSLFDIAGCLKRYLPQYHPYVLLELVQGGMLDRLNLILLQVAKSIVSEEDLRLGERRARTGSISVRETGTTLDAEYIEMYDYSDLDAQLFREEEQEAIGEGEVVKQVRYVPSLLLPVLQQGGIIGEEGDMFSHFTPLIQSCLAKCLPECELPDLLPLEAVELQAIVETLGNMRLLDGSLVVEAAGDQDVSVVDECGLRYRLALNRFIYCRQHSSERDFSSVITPGDYVWGFHSVEQEKLLKDIPSVARNSPDWDELRQAGVCWWVRSVEMLRPWIERLAKCRFNERSDPLDAALFYLALNKKSVLKHLFRTVGNAMKGMQ